ncbi:hypothetical protein B0H13DRAFT_1864775 [Mycena leptocephala]|nr:hypothetical protein B0H13DRAFT_1864775 [Mycena leptocephala]
MLFSASIALTLASILALSNNFPDLPAAGLHWPPHRGHDPLLKVYKPQPLISATWGTDAQGNLLGRTFVLSPEKKFSGDGICRQSAVVFWTLSGGSCPLCQGGGSCTALADVCTNTPGIQSLILNLDADCAGFPLPDCKFNSGQAVVELFSDDSDFLGSKGIQSVLCSNIDGTVNGFTAGSAEDREQEAVDEENGVFRMVPFA